MAAMVRPVVFPHLMAVMANCSLEVVGRVAGEKLDDSELCSDLCRRLHVII